LGWVSYLKDLSFLCDSAERVTLELEVNIFSEKKVTEAALVIQKMVGPAENFLFGFGIQFFDSNIFTV
jgi:hypothetical protein